MHYYFLLAHFSLWRIPRVPPGHYEDLEEIFMAHINPRLDPQATKIRNITRSILPCQAASRIRAKKAKLHGNRHVRRKLDSKLLIAQKQGCACADAAVVHCPVCDFFYDPKDLDFGLMGSWPMVDWRRYHDKVSMAIRWANFYRAGKDDDQWVTFISQAFPKNLIGRHAVFHIFAVSGIDDHLWRHLV